MKSFLIIGMGKFGHHMCDYLLALGNDVMVVDRNEKNVEDLISRVTNVQIGDCTDPDVIKSLGVGNFDMVLVCIGTNFESSLEITCLVKEMGARYVASKANRDVHAKFLRKVGADEIIYPDKNIAERLARSYSADSVFDYIKLADGYSMYEISIPEDWVGKTLRQLDIRKTYKINVVGLKYKDPEKEKETPDDPYVVNIVPDPDAVFRDSDRLMVVGKEESVEKLLHINGSEPAEVFRKKGRKGKKS